MASPFTPATLPATGVPAGGITNADVAAAAAIAASKLAPGLAGQLIGGTTPSYLYPPGYTVDFAQIVANATSTQTVEASADTVITGNLVTYDGTQVMIVVAAEAISNSVGGGAVGTLLNIWRDTTDLGRVVFTSATGLVSCSGFLFDTPPAGDHTYRLKMWVSGASTGTLFAGAGGVGTNTPARLRVLKA